MKKAMEIIGYITTVLTLALIWLTIFSINEFIAGVLAIPFLIFYGYLIITSDF